MTAKKEVSQETLREQIARLRLMASDCGETWDLSPNDQLAIREVLQSRAELLEALERARGHLSGLAAYLGTCATDTIVDNLETTIAALLCESAKYEAAISKATGKVPAGAR